MPISASSLQSLVHLNLLFLWLELPRSNFELFPAFVLCCGMTFNSVGQSKGQGSNSNRAEIWVEISAPPATLANSAMMNTLTIHCRWKDETTERTSHTPTYQSFFLFTNTACYNY